MGVGNAHGKGILKVSRRTYFDENGDERVVIIKEDECRYKTNGLCYNNNQTKTLGKKCYGCAGGKDWKEKKR